MNNSVAALRKVSLAYGLDAVNEWLELFGLKQTKLRLSAADHELLMGVDNIRDGYGTWTTDVAKVTAWASKHHDNIHTALWDECDAYGWDTPWQVLANWGWSDQCSWLLEDVIQGNVESLHSLPLAIGWWYGQRILTDYQNTEE